MLKIINKIFDIFINFLVFIITILILFSIYKIILINAFDKPYVMTFGYSAFEIATGSMEPTLDVKDLIIVKKTDDIVEGDIITFLDGSDLITHRVIKIDGDNITTKGDKNNSIDTLIERKDIVGKVVFIISKGGVFREIFLTPKIIISLIVTLILISLCLSCKKNKVNDNKSFQNIKDEVFMKDKKKKRK